MHENESKVYSLRQWKKIRGQWLVIAFKPESCFISKLDFYRFFVTQSLTFPQALFDIKADYILLDLDYGKNFKYHDNANEEMAKDKR